MNLHYIIVMLYSHGFLALAYNSLITVMYITYIFKYILLYDITHCLKLTFVKQHNVPSNVKLRALKY